MSSIAVPWVNIELECSSRKRRTLFYDCRKRTLDRKAASQAVSHNEVESPICSSGDRLDTEKPLLIAFHGGAGQPEQMEKLTGFISLAEEHDFFVAYPEGLNRGWNDGREVPARREIDDVDFLIKLVDNLRQSFPIDSKRVYACGISNGGFFAQYLAVRAPHLLAAVGSVAATVHEPMYKSLAVPVPVPIVFVIGKDDPVIPFAGGEIELARRKSGMVMPAQAGLEYWVAANHADFRYVETDLPVLDTEDSTRVSKRVYPALPDGKPVVAYLIAGGGHAWPMGWQYYRERYIGTTSRQLDASRALLDFFFAQCL